MVYEFPSGLKKHLQRSFHCLTSNDDIETYMNNNKQNTIINDNNNFKCNKCNKCFSYKHTFERHMETTICGKSQNIKHILLNKNINSNKFKKIVKEEALKITSKIDKININNIVSGLSKKYKIELTKTLNNLIQ